MRARRRAGTSALDRGGQGRPQLPLCPLLWFDREEHRRSPLDPASSCISLWPARCFGARPGEQAACGSRPRPCTRHALCLPSRAPLPIEGQGPEETLTLRLAATPHWQRLPMRDRRVTRVAETRPQIRAKASRSPSLPWLGWMASQGRLEHAAGFVPLPQLVDQMRKEGGGTRCLGGKGGCHIFPPNAMLESVESPSV